MGWLIWFVDDLFVVLGTLGGFGGLLFQYFVPCFGWLVC